ncbi:Domain of unknown function (DUF1985 [Striga hermonthica]|uniref:DUF1985 domain-containing protein n=1 Tax=Striga hermonthica TaxID=68872 RepID=A0A9N7NRI2_STRHE|nr:Domain of unknown function (DUF1985 [Striga hermonthica]
MKKQVPYPDSDDFQSDHGRKNPKHMRRYPKSKIPNSTEKGNSSNSDFVDEFNPKTSLAKNIRAKRNPRDINVKVQNSNDNSKEKCTISDIKKMLTKEQLEAFRMSAFGKFLDLPHCIVQNQLVNYILLREVHQSRTYEIWFDFGGKFLRFGIEEFVVVTGLKCTGLSKKLNIPKIANGLHDKYFAGLELTRSHIMWQFMKKLWASDEDAMKFAKLHFLANFLMGSQDALHIDRCFVDMIDSPECDDYSWGTVVFQFTLQYLKK